jgi:hypothetical protein
MVRVIVLDIYLAVSLRTGRRAVAAHGESFLISIQCCGRKVTRPLGRLRRSKGHNYLGGLSVFERRNCYASYSSIIRVFFMRESDVLVVLVQ